MTCACAVDRFSTAGSLTDGPWTVVSVMALSKPEENCYGPGDCGCPTKVYAYYDLLKERKFVLQILQNHGLIAKNYECPRCKNSCQIDNTRFVWRCTRNISVGDVRLGWLMAFGLVYALRGFKCMGNIYFLQKRTYELSLSNFTLEPYFCIKLYFPRIQMHP